MLSAKNVSSIHTWELYGSSIEGKVTWQMKHLGLSQSIERWSAPQLEHGYAFLGPVDGAPVVGVAARTSLGGWCGWSRVRLPWGLMIDEGASWYAA